MSLTTPILDVRLLGGFRVAVGGHVLPDAAWRRKRAAALVKLLAATPGHRLHREQVVEALWPETDPDAAATNLRVTLHRARQPLESAGAPSGLVLTRDGEVLSLGAADAVRVDVDDFEAAVARAWRHADPDEIETAIALYGGDLLPEDLYDDWAESRRATLRASYLALLRRLAEVRLKRGEASAAVAALERLLAAEPTDESASAGLMRVLARTGQRQRALARYERLVAALREHVGAAPEAAITRLRDDIREGRFPAPRRDAAPTAAQMVQTGAPRHALPAPVDTLIGRERELAELGRLLDVGRLVTLTGPGGVGKTRLAIAAAWDQAGAFPGGAVFVDLSALTDAELVIPAIASVLEARQEGGVSLFAAVKRHIGEQRALLVLDNFEQVLPAAAVVADLLTACPRLTILATSRARLRLRGEREYPVAPLEWPRAGNGPDNALALPEIAASSAVALFVERAREARPDFVLDEGNAREIAEICRRLDGLPLALELAAARTRVLSPAALLDRLARPLSLLTGGADDLPARQRTLRATIGWSYDLLQPATQRLLRTLAVFAGGWTLEAAEWVSGAGGQVSETGRGGEKSRSRGVEPDHRVISLPTSDTRPPTPDTLDPLTALVDQSLVRKLDGGDSEPRFTMLATIREFALEQLDAAGEREVVSAAHARYVLGLAEAARASFDGPDQAIWLDRIEREHDNLRAALGWLLRADGADSKQGLRLAADLWWFWWVRGHLSEGRSWLARALGGRDTAPSAHRARALTGAGTLAESQGDYDAAEQLHTEALESWREIGDARGVTNALSSLGTIAQDLGDLDRATTLHEESLAICRRLDDRLGAAYARIDLGTVASRRGDEEQAREHYTDGLATLRELGDWRGLATGLTNLGTMIFVQGDPDQAAPLYEEALAISRTLGDKQGTALALANLGEVMQRRQELDRARTLLDEALALYRDVGDERGVGSVLAHLGHVAWDRGDFSQAANLLAEGLSIAQSTQDQEAIAGLLESLAGVAVAQGDLDRSVRLFARAQALRDEIGSPLPEIARSRFDRNVSASRQELGDMTFCNLWENGRAAPLADIIADAVALAG